MKKLTCLMTFIFVFIVLTGNAAAMRPVPIEDITHAVPNFDKPLSASDVRKSILKAALARRWQPVEVAEGKIRLQLEEKRKNPYQLVIDVIYDDKNYTIKYVSSNGLRYNESSRTIHPSYQRWTHMLVTTIYRELGSLSLKAGKSTIIHNV
jgi:hypothetical protein